MDINILITANNLKKKNHNNVSMISKDEIKIRTQNETLNYAPKTNVTIKINNGIFEINDISIKSSILEISSGSRIKINNITRLFQDKNINLELSSKLTFLNNYKDFKIIQTIDIEKYVAAALAAEMPKDIHIEALKAQALAIRTYALNPRISHMKDQSNVCDSYFCCLYYCGDNTTSAKYISATNQTKSQIITYQNKPILAIFSSCSGGQTNSYQDCFATKDDLNFPSEKINYLISVREGHLPDKYINFTLNKKHHQAIKYLHQNKTNECFDAKFKYFKWTKIFTFNELENVIHFNVAKLSQQKEFKHLIINPDNNKFGSIDSIEVTKYSDSNLAMELTIKTNLGSWRFLSQLLIRKIFEHCHQNESILLSAKIAIDNIYQNKRLEKIVIYGLGFGHGVGLQQIGASQMAKSNFNYKQIIEHYYQSTQICNIENCDKT